MLPSAVLNKFNIFTAYILKAQEVKLYKIQMNKYAYSILAL